MAMVVIGFRYRHKCQADVTIPHYLFFGGICGLIAVAMRLLMIFTWKCLQHHYDKGYVMAIMSLYTFKRKCFTLKIMFLMIYQKRFTNRFRLNY